MTRDGRGAYVIWEMVVDMRKTALEVVTALHQMHVVCKQHRGKRVAGKNLGQYGELAWTRPAFEQREGVSAGKNVHAIDQGGE